jgi:FAD/FMN-containing dehydrogenase
MRRRAFCASALALASTSGLSFRRLLAASSVATEIPVIRRDGKQGAIAASDVADLKARLRGELLVPGQSGYEQARKVWNGAFDRRPSVIARCVGAADVIQAVTFARAHNLLVAVRGGGHSLSGQSVCNGGLVIDLSRMRSVRVDPLALVARVEPGVLLGELDRETQFFGLVMPAGTVSDTGAAGLTLGGGYGRLTRRFGLACDNLIGADVITADGRYVRTSEQENPDLLWGLRGGGGNFGVVTSFEYRLHPVSSMMYGGQLMFSPADTPDVAKFFANVLAEAPDELYLDGWLTVMPKVGRVMMCDICYSGPLNKADRVLEPLLRFRKPVQNTLAPATYVALQSSGDAGSAPGRGYYERSGFLRGIGPSLIDASLAIMDEPNAIGQIDYWPHGGAVSRVKPDATAIWHRDAECSLLVDSDWNDPHDQRAAETAMQWAREAWRKLEQFTDGFYVNTMAGDDPHRRVRSTYGGNYPRLVKLKDKYDPTNLFHLNANVPPSTMS